MAGFGQIDQKLAALGFQGSGAMRLVIGKVTIIGGISLRGLTFMFTEVTPRTMTQYEVCGPTSASVEEIRSLIRLNLIQNHRGSVEEWDALQYNLEKSKLNK